LYPFPLPFQMPEKVKQSWADAVENEDGPARKSLPQPTEVIAGDVKTVTEYKYNEDDKRVKVGN